MFKSLISNVFDARKFGILGCLLLSLLFIFSDSFAAEVELSSAIITELNAAFDAGTLNSEKLVQLYLHRIDAYNNNGPTINAVLMLNPNALSQARALDIERLNKGPRSPMHGSPVVIKDNLDTADMPTTAGSFRLKNSYPPDDAFLVKKLSDAGAIILAKLNMSEFASGDALSSPGGAIGNPHSSTRSPEGSLGGTGRPLPL